MNIAETKITELAIHLKRIAWELEHATSPVLTNTLGNAVDELWAIQQTLKSFLAEVNA